LEDKIWEKLSNTNQQVEPEKNKMIASAENMVAKQAPIIVRLMPFVVAASLALFSISSYLAWSYSRQLKNAEERIAAIEKENLNSQIANRIQKEEYAKAVKLLNVFNQNGINMVKLVGKEVSPESKIMVCWNKTTQEVMLHDMNMPDPPKGKGYQLWAIVDGKPVDLGMISLEAKKEMITMKKGVAKPSAFAITLEDEGGVESPTMEQLYVIGNI
ncbi:MAG: anti-sigma factor, partial [Bacteroidetes bacterium]|nr:anti-sigma factor [Bacteroidota bacterium]